MVERKDWPEGWIAERKELVVEDAQGGTFIFKFVPAKVTNIPTEGDERTTRNVARCCSCRTLVEPDQDSLWLHSYKHLFLQIPFGAKGEVRA